MRRNAGGLPGIILENVAIAREEGERTFHYLEPGPGDARPELYKTIGSFQRENLERHAQYIAHFDERVVSKPLPCLPLEALCRRHGLEHLDLLFCDAEGYDFEVLQTLDWERTPPRLVVWEHQHLSAEDARACCLMLEERGYDVKRLSKDSVAARGRHSEPCWSASECARDWEGKGKRSRFGIGYQSRSTWFRISRKSLRSLIRSCRAKVSRALPR
jgi:hypothetical protein